MLDVFILSWTESSSVEFVYYIFFSHSFQITISYVYEAWFQIEIFNSYSVEFLFLFSNKNNTQYILIWIFTKKIYPILLHILKTSQYILLFLIPLGFFYFLIRFFFFSLSLQSLTCSVIHSIYYSKTTIVWAYLYIYEYKK